MSVRGDAGLVIALVGIVVLAWLYRRDRLRFRRRRGAFFTDCLALFETYHLEQDDLAFAVLTGTYRGFDLRLEPVVDDIGFRKVPSLWITVTVRAPVRYSGILDVLMRPQGVEFYSPFADLEYEVPRPAGCPRDAVIHSDDPSQTPPAESIAPHLALFEDPRMKELLIAPAGVRLVYHVTQAQRTEYVVLRHVQFSDHRLSPQLAQHLVDAALAVHHSVAFTN